MSLKGKEFTERPARQPRDIQNDPAHKRAAAAFGPEALAAAAATQAPEQPASQQPEAPASGVPVQPAAPVAPSPAPPPAAPPPIAVKPVQPAASLSSSVRGAVDDAEARTEKQNAQPSVAAREHLRTLRRRYKKAESFVAEYAIMRYFAAFSNEQIAERLRALGHGLRRAIGAPTPGKKLTVYVSASCRSRLDSLADDHGIAGGIVVGDAIDWTFANETDEQIANTLSQHGLGLRRERHDRKDTLAS